MACSYMLTPYLVYWTTKFIHQHENYVGEQTRAGKKKKMKLYFLFLDVGGFLPTPQCLFIATFFFFFFGSQKDLSKAKQHHKT